MRTRHCLSAVALLLGAVLAPGQQTSEISAREALDRMLASQRQVTEYLQRQAQEITNSAVAELGSVERWESVRARRVDELRDMLGLLPWPERTPLNTRITGTLDKGGYTIEKIAFESMPRLYVTGNLYVPKNLSSKAPAVIYVCGHAYSPHGDKAKYQRHGISLAKNGYVAFILDSIQIAETFSLHHGVHSQEMFDWYTRGYTPAGVEVWNAMRAIDYLETRPEVDASKIGMTGRSGGAGMSWFTAAVDPRVKVAIPVMGISTYAANLKEDTQRLHCDCMFCINTHRQDMIHQAALIAPRPVLMMHGAKDNLFPVEGFREVERVMGDLYRAYGKPEAFGNIVVDTGHQDSDYLREQAIRFFDKHLMAIPERELDMDYSNAPEEQLSVFGGNPPADARNYRVHEFFTPSPAPSAPNSLAEWNTRKAALRGILQELLESGSEGLPAPRLDIHRPKQATGRRPALLYVSSDGEDSNYHNRVLSGAHSRDEVVRAVVWPVGVGEVPWPKTFWRATLRNAMHVGETVDSLRLRDVLSAVKTLREMPEVDPARITIAGKGISGILGLYAAILEPEVYQVILLDAPESHREGPVFLNVMRHTDLPEAAALLAPRRLLFYGHMPPAYSFTKRMYSLMGEEDKIEEVFNLEFVANGQYGTGFASGR